jgi:LemA protein
LALATLSSGCGYGEINALDEQVKAARHEIEVQLQRRAELVPSLVETVEAYAAAGDELVTVVSDARIGLAGAVRSGDFAEMQVANTELCSALNEMLASARRFPNLLGDPAYQLLQSQLEATGERIEEAGGAYNDAARRYNDFIAQFPQLVTAKVIGAEKLEPFENSPKTPEASSE